MEKRVLIFTNHFYPEYFKINDVVDWFSTENIITSVVTSNPNYPKGKILNGFSIFGSKKKHKTATVFRLPVIPRGGGGKLFLSLNYLSYFLSLFLFTFWLIVTHRKYDTLLIHHTSPPLLFLPALIYKKIKGSKVILWDLDMWPHTLSAVGIIKSKTVLSIAEKLFKWFYKKFDLILLGSKSFKEIANKRISPEKSVYYPNWAESIFENVKHKNISSTKSEKIVISYTGNLGEAQNLENLVEAISLCKRNKIEVRLIGDGRNKENLKSLVESKNLKETIKFFEPVSSSKLLKYFKESDYLFLSLNDNPLFSKTVPAKLQTYMAVGIPIIGALSGEANSIIKENNIGFCINANQANELAKIFDSLSLVQDSLYQTMKKNCRDLYLKDFSSLKRKKILLELI